MNFPILPGPVSGLFLERGFTDFSQAAEFIRSLPYKRNSSKEDSSIVLRENCGTCSTKHAVLALLASEHNIPGVQLMMGIYKMNSVNTPRIGKVLENAGLAYIPEAHNYLRVNGEVLDCTVPGQGFSFIDDLLEEKEILPSQVGDHKVHYHQEFLRRWLVENPSIKLTFAELWKLREQCIQNLSA
jgi:hypothetical protein